MVPKREQFNLERIATKNTINSEMCIIKILWNLFMSERWYNLPTSFKNVIDLFYEQVKNDVELFILFGSVAQGLATEESDIDICVVSGKDINARRFEFLPHRFEINMESKIKIIEEEIVREGERIWLI